MTEATLKNILKSFSKGDLLAMINQRDILLEEETTNRSKLTQAIIYRMESEGIQQTTCNLKLSALKQVCTELEVKLGEYNKTATRPVLQKRLAERMRDEGLVAFIESIKLDEIVKTFIWAAGGEEPADDAATEDLQAHAIRAIQYQGAFNFFSYFETGFLVDLLNAAGLDHNTSSKTRLVQALCTLTNAVVEEKEQVEVTYADRKLPLKAKYELSYHDINEWYTAKELIEWCDEKGVKTSGTKRELVRRVMAYLGGDTENTLKQNNKPKKEKTEKVEKPKKKEKAYFNSRNNVAKKSKKVKKEEEEDDVQVEKVAKKSKKNALKEVSAPAEMEVA